MLLPPLLLLPLLWAGSLAEDSQYRIHLEQQVTLQEGQCALVFCVVIYPSKSYMESIPAYGYWFKEGKVSGHKDILVATNNSTQQVQKETQGRFHLVGDPRAHSCSLDIRDARREDAGTYYFRVERGPVVRYSYKSYLLNVTVTALTQTPDIQILGTLQSGRPSTITCSAPWACPRGTTPTFSWTGVALPSWGTNSPVLSLTPGSQHHSTSLTCRVSFPGASVSTERTVRLSVAYAPQNLTIQVIRKEGSGPTVLGNGSALLVQEGQSLRLVCMVDSHPLASLSWVGRTLTVKSSVNLSPIGAGGAGEHSQNLELELPSVHLDDQEPVLCRAQHPLGSQEASLHLSVQRPLGARTGVILGATGGVAVTALLALCLFFIVRSCRRREEETMSFSGLQAAERTSSGSGMSDSALFPQGPLNGSGTAIPGTAISGPPGPAAWSPSEKEQEQHYTSLTFHKGKPQNLQAQETTEYSEINI